MIKAVLFDLDGTIINSEEGITKCVQYALRAYGIDEPDRTKLRCFIGPPLDPVFREKYGMTEAEAWQSVEKYRERFDVKGIFEWQPLRRRQGSDRALQGAWLSACACVFKARDSVQKNIRAL